MVLRRDHNLRSVAILMNVTWSEEMWYMSVDFRRPCQDLHASFLVDVAVDLLVAVDIAPSTSITTIPT